MFDAKRHLTDAGDFMAMAARLGGLDPFFNSARALGVARWGAGIGAMVAASASRFPRRDAIVDDHGSVSYSLLDRQASNLGGLLRSRGSGSDSAGAVGILCRNHRGFVLAQVAAERAGRDVVMLSTALPRASLVEVVERECIDVLICDLEFEQLVTAIASESRVRVIFADAEGASGLQGLAGVRRKCPPPRRRGRLVMLTSGTTGPPKGARRDNKAPGGDAISLFATVPYSTGGNFLVCPPLFHAWGLSQATVALSTGATLHLMAKFDVETTIAIMRSKRIDTLAVVPLMLKRLLRSPEVSDIRPPAMVLSSGNVLSGDLAIEWMDRFGDKLYNFYGSTEAALGTIATPAELRASPGTVGRAPRGVVIGILDREGMPVPAGKRGRVHLSSSMKFAGYTDGTGAESFGDLMATGDLGYLDEQGLLHVEGRVNDMIVTGGENVFPSRVEEVLERHPDVDNAAVVGLADDEYGQRVVAFVVVRKGRELTAESLVETARGDLQTFMVPKEVRFVDSLPMTTTGKVIRRELKVLGDPDRV